MYHGRFKGTHYEAGYKWGRMLREHGNVIKDSPTFDLTEERREFAALCIPEYERHYPEILEEIRGIADGQQSSFEMLTTLLLSMYCFELQNKCTCFAFSDGGKTVFGRNSDFLVKIEKLYMNCLYRLDGAFALNGNTTSFVQLEDGVNEYGFAAGLTFVYPHIRKPGLNAGMLVRHLLETCKTTEEAIEKLKEIPIASAQTLTVADRNGSIAVVECNPQKTVVIHPEQGECFVAAANNFHSEELQNFRNPNGIDDWRSDERYHTAATALGKNRGQYSVDFAKALLAGKYGFICQYDRKKGADTVWSVVYDLTDNTVYRVEGNPSRKAFRNDERMAFRS
jgi:predicted choloylglycine hydrolase